MNRIFQNFLTEDTIKEAYIEFCESGGLLSRSLVLQVIQDVSKTLTDEDLVSVFIAKNLKGIVGIDDNILEALQVAVLKKVEMEGDDFTKGKDFDKAFQDTYERFLNILPAFFITAMSRQAREIHPILTPHVLHHVLRCYRKNFYTFANGSLRARLQQITQGDYMANLMALEKTMAEEFDNAKVKICNCFLQVAQENNIKLNSTGYPDDHAFVEALLGTSFFIRLYKFKTEQPNTNLDVYWAGELADCLGEEWQKLSFEHSLCRDGAVKLYLGQD